MELSNSIQSRRDIKKVINEVFNAIFLINWTFQLGTNNKIKTPNKGNNKTLEINDIEIDFYFGDYKNVVVPKMNLVTFHIPYGKKKQKKYLVPFFKSDESNIVFCNQIFI